MRIDGGEAIVRSLIRHKVETVFGLPGAHVLGVYEALRNESRIRHVSAMHEINAAFMADAQARLTGLPGVCLLTSGPGATNAVTAIAQAYTDASPVVQITGHCGNNEKIQPSHGVDDWDFLLKIYSPITKWSVQIRRAEDIAPILDKAFKLASSGRPGPVHVEIPRDVLSSSVKSQDFPVVDSDIHQEIDEAPVKGIAQILRSSDRPLIAVGKGVLREFCSKDVMELAQAIDAPIVVQDAVSAIPYDFPLYVGYDMEWHPQIDSLIKGADATITLGLDLRERFMFSKAKNHKLVHVHSDAFTNKNEELDTSVSRPLVDLVASVKKTIELLLKLIPHKRSVRSNAEKKVSEIKRKISDDVSSCIKWGCKPLHPGEVGTQLRRVLKDNAIVTLDVGDSSWWINTCFRAREPNTVLVPGRYGSMGFALPAAVAAKLTFPERDVVAVTGDGGFLMSCMDFPSAVKHKLAIKVIVVSNGHYGTIWRLQNDRYGGTMATEIQVPDFAQYAESFGARGFSVYDHAELGKVLEEAISLRGPAIVGVHTNHRFPPYRPGRLARSILRHRSIRASAKWTLERYRRVQTRN